MKSLNNFETFKLNKVQMSEIKGGVLRRLIYFLSNSCLSLKQVDSCYIIPQYLLMRRFLRFFLITIFWSIRITGQESNVTIYLQTDTIISAKEQWVYLYYLQHNETFLQDSALITPEKRDVVLHAYVIDEVEVSILFSQKGPNHLFLVASPNDTIHVNISEEDGGGMVWKKVIGSPATNERAEIMDFSKKIRLALLDLEESLYSISKNDSAELEKMKDSINILNKRLKERNLRTIKHSKHSFNIWSALISPTLIAQIGMDSVNALRKEAYKRFPNSLRLKKLCEPNKPSLPATEATKKTDQRIQRIIANKTMKIRNSSIKKPNAPLIEENEKKNKFPPLEGEYALYNFSLKNSNDEVTSLMQLYGQDKYILIVFWASWCIPCIKDMGLLKRLHQHYKEKLTICLISLDINKSYWENAINRHQLEEFINLIATENGILNKDIERLKIRKIPHNYLLSPKGEIIAIDIFEADLAKKIKGQLDSP